MAQSKSDILEAIFRHSTNATMELHLHWIEFEAEDFPFTGAKNSTNPRLSFDAWKALQENSSFKWSDVAFGAWSDVWLIIIVNLLAFHFLLFPSKDGTFPDLFSLSLLSFQLVTCCNN